MWSAKPSRHRPQTFPPIRTTLALLAIRQAVPEQPRAPRQIVRASRRLRAGLLEARLTTPRALRRYRHSHFAGKLRDAANGVGTHSARGSPRWYKARL